MAAQSDPESTGGAGGSPRQQNRRQPRAAVACCSAARLHRAAQPGRQLGGSPYSRKQGSPACCTGLHRSRRGRARAAGQAQQGRRTPTKHPTPTPAPPGRPAMMSLMSASTRVPATFSIARAATWAASTPKLLVEKRIWKVQGKGASRGMVTRGARLEEPQRPGCLHLPQSAGGEARGRRRDAHRWKARPASERPERRTSRAWGLPGPGNPGPRRRPPLPVRGSRQEGRSGGSGACRGAPL